MFLIFVVFVTYTLAKCSTMASVTSRHAGQSNMLEKLTSQHRECEEKSTQKSTVQKYASRVKRGNLTNIMIPENMSEDNPAILSVLDVPIMEIRVVHKIVNGEDAQPGEFPYMVSLRYKSFDEHFCGGTLVTAQHVLTAAHCVAEIASTDDVYVVSGSISSIKGGRKHYVREIRKHPKYIGGLNYWLHDVAVLKLRKTLNFDKMRQPVAIAKRDPESGTLCNVSGWGYIRPWHRSPSTILQSLKQVVVEQSECQKVYSAIARIADNHVCGYWGMGYGACGGDSGGPLVCDGKQQGIVSFSSGCDHGYPSVYTRVSLYYDWIKENIQDVDE